jgi:hypothetical protein
MAKETLREETIKNQKLELKVLALGRINEKFEDEMRQKTQKE